MADTECRAAAPAAAVASPLRIGRRTGAVLFLATVAGVVMFCWPLFVRAGGDPVGHTADAPFVFVLVLPFVVAIVLASFAEGGMDSKTLAMLGVLSAINAALRPLGAGIAGIETVFFMLVLAGRVFGPGFGFVLGCTSLFASALLTAGVGPWLPFQMLAAAWIGLVAGLLPGRVRGRAEVVMLVGYGVVAAYGFGMLMNLWFWPFTAGPGTSVSFVPGDPVLDNLHRFAVYSVTSTSLGWDTGRAVTNAVAIAVLGPAVLATLRRAARRASFGAVATFAEGHSRAAASPEPPNVPRRT
jgi:energy-coupling factor transport system substrate-specific component